MGWITKFGTQWGDVPQTSGAVYWVAPVSPYTVEGRAYSSSDNNDGLSPERALATIGQAITNATANANDVIMLLPSATAHTSAATVTLSKAGLTFVGCQPHMRLGPEYRNYPLNSKVNWGSTFAGVGITNTAADTTFVGINFIPVTAQSMMTVAAAARNTFIDCSVTMSSAVSTSTKGFVFSGASPFATFTNCVCLNNVATSAQGPWLDLTGAANFMLDHCQTIQSGTSGAWAVAIQLGAGSSGTFNECYLNAVGVGTMTIGIDGTGVAVANAITLMNCRYGVSPGAGAVKNGTNANFNIVNNYYATIGAGLGTVIQTITV